MLSLAIVGLALKIVAKEGVIGPIDEEGALKVPKGDNVQKNPRGSSGAFTVHVLSFDHSLKKEEASANLVKKSSWAFFERSDPPPPQKKKEDWSMRVNCASLMVTRLP